MEGRRGEVGRGRGRPERRAASRRLFVRAEAEPHVPSAPRPDPRQTLWHARRLLRLTFSGPVQQGPRPASERDRERATDGKAVCVEGAGRGTTVAGGPRRRGSESPAREGGLSITGGDRYTGLEPVRPGRRRGDAAVSAERGS